MLRIQRDKWKEKKLRLTYRLTSIARKVQERGVNSPSGAWLICDKSYQIMYYSAFQVIYFSIFSSLSPIRKSHLDFSKKGTGH